MIYVLEIYFLGGIWHMKFGHFDDQTREYVIETPKTPYPWIN